MADHRRLIAALVVVLISSATLGRAATIITDNNLTSFTRPDISNPSGSVVTDANFVTVTNRLVAWQGTVTNTFASAPANGYTIDSLTPGGSAVTVNWAPIPPNYSAVHTLTDAVVGTNALTFNLNVGAAGPFRQYTFTASNIKFYQPAGADYGLMNKAKGNLVPNASFENTALNFFNGNGVSFAADPGQQGANVLRIVGTVDAYIQLPVEPGKTYGYDFWYKIATDNYGQIEYGLNPLGFSTAIATGNTGTGLLLNQAWTEVSGTFVPAAGQNYFYIGGLANTSGSGAAVGVSFDSFFVSELVPEPSTVLLGAVGAGLILGRRRRSGARR